MEASRLIRTVAVAVILAVAPGASGVTIDLTTVGSPSNANDTGGYGRVDYEYGIGMYEVTAGQYCEFLNAVATDDTYELYNASMWSEDEGCKIQQTGSPGSYTYSVLDPNRTNRPVNLVSWGDAARFCNWLHNGQPTGAQDLTTTEDGSYALNGATSNTALIAVTRDAAASYVLPTEDEWYKAAYYDPLALGGAGGYFDYPTRSNDALPPNNDVTHPDSGNSANYKDPCYAIGAPYYVTKVGEFEYSHSPWGTFDQGGNVTEWNETVSAIFPDGRALRGGSYMNDVDDMRVSALMGVNPTAEYKGWGFRVGYVPEPGMIALLAMGVMGLMGRRRFAARSAQPFHRNGRR